MNTEIIASEGMWLTQASLDDELQRVFFKRAFPANGLTREDFTEWTDAQKSEWEEWSEKQQSGEVETVDVQSCRTSEYFTSDITIDWALSNAGCRHIEVRKGDVIEIAAGSNDFSCVLARKTGKNYHYRYGDTIEFIGQQQILRNIFKEVTRRFAIDADGEILLSPKDSIPEYVKIYHNAVGKMIVPENEICNIHLDSSNWYRKKMREGTRTYNIGEFSEPNDIVWTARNVPKTAGESILWNRSGKNLYIAVFSHYAERVYNIPNNSSIHVIIRDGVITIYHSTSTGMFQGDSLIRDLDLRQMSLAQATSLAMLFAYCDNLRSLDIRGWDANLITNADSIFVSDGALETLIGGDESLDNAVLQGLHVALDLSPTILDRYSIRAVINGLADLTEQTSKTLTLGSTLRAKLTEEDIAIATGKNWIIA